MDKLNFKIVLPLELLSEKEGACILYERVAYNLAIGNRGRLDGIGCHARLDLIEGALP